MSNSNKTVFILVLSLIGSILLFEFSSIDIQFQSLFYNQEAGHWLISRDNTLLKWLFYDAVKALYLVFIIVLLITLVFFSAHASLYRYRRGLLVVLLSTLLVPATIGVLKAVTDIPCPRDLSLFGGEYPHVTLLARYPPSFHHEHTVQCYPAGHASGGFALMALFFLFRQRRNRLIGLATGLATGWATGGYKMLIGDHFLSHTVTTMLLAGLIILLVDRFLPVSGVAD